MSDLAIRLAEVQALQATLTAKKADYAESLDTLWMIITLSFIFVMHSGFSLLEVGSVRFMNAQNILAKNLVVVCVGFLCWYFIGYTLAFGVTESPGKFAGSTNWVMDGFWADKKLIRFWLFQGTFCATGGTIVSGAMAERTQLKGFMTFTVLMTSIIYPIVVYWAWSGYGLLNYMEDGEQKSIFGAPYLDFAGSGVVHLIGGVAALCGSAIVGPRLGWGIEGSTTTFDGHHVPFQVLGTLFLLFGWFGFNPGSTGAMSTMADANTAGLVAVNTLAAGCVSGLVVFTWEYLSSKVIDVGGFCNGVLAGLVAVTAACSTVKPWESIVIGIIGGMLYRGASKLLKHPKVKIDDVVDAFAVHGMNGGWGVLAAGIFGDPAEGIGGNGCLYGGDQLTTQVGAFFLIVVWSGIWSVLIFLPLRIFGMLRMSDGFQEAGADAKEHSPQKAYNHH